jgi:hypothetical protein
VTLTIVPIQPAPKPDKKQQMLDRLAALAPPELLKCHRCGSMEFIETRVGVERAGKGKPKGGKKTLICMHCMVLRQERVEIR